MKGAPSAVRMIVRELAARLRVGCVMSVPRQGIGFRRWGSRPRPVTLREMAGMGFDSPASSMPFRCLRLDITRSMEEQPVRGRLEPDGILRVPIPRVGTGGDAEYEFVGMDDRGRHIRVLVRVQFRQAP